MHSAPSVSYPVGRSRFAGMLLAGAWLAGAAVLALWGWQAAVPGWRQAAGGVALGAAGLCAGYAWLRTPAGELDWDGAGWSWRGGAGAAVAALDLQHAILLRWRGAAGGVQWLWAERASRPDRWDALRRAVYSRATPDALQGAKPPAAKP